MLLRPANARPSQASYALLLALAFLGVNLLILTSMLEWTSGSTRLTDRNNAYNQAIGAAEAATEQVLSSMTRDYFNQSFNPAGLSGYRNLIPTNDWAAEYEFSDGDGNVNQTWVYSSPTQVLTNLNSPFTGLYGSNYICAIRSNVKPMSPAYPYLAVGVRQDFQLASLPIFQFGIYYGLDLEINPHSAMTVTGQVHGNADIYVSPDNMLEFADAVGAVGNIYYNRSPNDPEWTSGVLPVYDSIHEEHVSSLTLPIGTNNNPVAVRQILDPPPPGEDATSPLGKQRYYNKADLILITTDTKLIVKYNLNGAGTGGYLEDDPPLTNTSSYPFLNTDVSFYDYREGKSVLSTEIDVGIFNLWMRTNSTAASFISMKGRALNSIYVDDQRTAPGSLTAVRVTDGQILPPNGLTIATARPLYVKGHFNLNNYDDTPGLTDTSQTQPASLVGDSITILSTSWNDGYTKDTALGGRPAANTTVNAALLAGIVPSTTDAGGNKHYSGGVENFPRLLEDWSGSTLTINGSMVALFPSRYATNYWSDPNSPSSYYYRPARQWAFDKNFLNWNKLPPCTPQLLQLVRSQWSVIAASSPN
jgi:hypothetical protein